MKKIYTENAPEPVGPYSQAILAGNTIYLSGQIPLDPATGAIIGRDIESQTEQVMKNISSVLEAAGAGFESVVKATCFLASIEDFPTFNAIYERYFISKPARSCVEVARLPKDALVEVEVTAVI